MLRPGAPVGVPVLSPPSTREPREPGPQRVGPRGHVSGRRALAEVDTARGSRIPFCVAWWEGGRLEPPALGPFVSSTEQDTRGTEEGKGPTQCPCHLGSGPAASCICWGSRRKTRPCWVSPGRQRTRSSGTPDLHGIAPWEASRHPHSPPLGKGRRPTTRGPHPEPQGACAAGRHSVGCGPCAPVLSRLSLDRSRQDISNPPLWERVRRECPARPIWASAPAGS